MVLVVWTAVGRTTTLKRALVSKILKSNFTRFVFEKFEVFCITVISCDPLPVYVHAHINSTMTSYDTRVLVTCDAGHLLADNSTHVVVTCGSDAEWSEVPHDCTGSRKQKTTNTQRIVQTCRFCRDHLRTSSRCWERDAFQQHEPVARGNRQLQLFRQAPLLGRISGEDDRVFG